ncbi:2-dehydropantoate 2-reductase [Cohnella algarum]|uniref:2-dehydropantoate 2-reductase n=1 Tax=Cohnella algarum TaxID=2044859 RepID=UPI00196811C5|nr:2-dehydropantoate 2-reductase [Cohnella algarum]
MRIAIVGGGALGLLFGGRLAAAGRKAELWTRTREQAELLSSAGIRLMDADGGSPVDVPVAARAVDDVPADGGGPIAFLAVKQTSLSPELLAGLRRAVPPGGAIIALMNGIGHTDLLADALPGRAIVAAVTTEAALKVDPRSVLHAGRGTTWLGQAPLFGTYPARYADPMPEETAFAVEKCLLQAGFSVSLSNDMMDRMLRKLLVNAVVNPLTALLRLRNGELSATADRRSLMRAVYEESAAILAPYGLRDPELLWREVLDVCEGTAANRSSMLQDVLAGRPTEIDAINGAIARMGSAIGRSASWNEKLAALVKAISGE